MKNPKYEKTRIATLVAACASAFSLPLHAAPQLIATSNLVTVDATVINNSSIAVSFLPASPGGMTLLDLSARGTKLGDIQITETGTAFDSVFVSENNRAYGDVLINNAHAASDPKARVGYEFTSNGLSQTRIYSDSNNLPMTSSGGSGWYVFPSQSNVTVITVKTSGISDPYPGVYSTVIETLVANK